MQYFNKFQLSSLYPDGLEQIFDFFPQKIQKFSGNPKTNLIFFPKSSKQIFV
jgi:hypothetical protein